MNQTPASTYALPTSPRGNQDPKPISCTLTLKNSPPCAHAQVEMPFHKCIGIYTFGKCLLMCFTHA